MNVKTNNMGNMYNKRYEVQKAIMQNKMDNIKLRNVLTNHSYNIKEHNNGKQK